MKGMGMHDEEEEEPAANGFKKGEGIYDDIAPDEL